MLHIRVANELKDKLESLAKASGRSMNSEIVQRLEMSISHRPAPALPETAEINNDERSLVRMWRAMNESERYALRVVAERLADRADSGGTT